MCVKLGSLFAGIWLTWEKTSKDQCLAVIEIITGGCVWYERETDGKKVMCKLCKREPDSVEHFEYMTVEYKWQVILTDSGYTDFNMFMPLGCMIASRMFDPLRKKKALCRGD